ncbi:hypothetical protein Taro_035718 [Colocasia esculenta]|uniref:Uncharacterized protein n=1 Tax=Colocasia esculenta TaxID=4460 RepID=A0A843W6H2_COLES|nr:hypothetical protein [Colocasia esculenta]
MDPNIYSREHGKQTRIDDAYNQQGPRYKVGRTVAKWWHHSGISFNAANSPYYKTMIQEVLRVVDGDRRPTIELVYAKIETAKKIREVSPRYAHLVLNVVEDRWDRQMSRDLHMAAYYLHPAYHYALELSYEDDLTAAFTRIKSFREGVRSFAEPSAIADRDRIDGDPMVAWVARATTERREYELDEEADDHKDPPHPNTFLARAIKAIEEEERGDGDVRGGRQPHSSQFQAEEEDEVDLLGDLRMERAMPSTDLETLDPNAEETPSEDSPRLPSSRSHDSMTIGSPGGSVGGGDGDGGGDGRNDGDRGGGGGEGGQGGGGGGGIHFTAKQHYGGHCTQDTDHGGPVQYNRRQKFVKGGRAEGSAVDSDSYNTMISDFERMSTHESVGSYGGHSYQPESSNTGYSSGYSGYSHHRLPCTIFSSTSVYSCSCSCSADLCSCRGCTNGEFEDNPSWIRGGFKQRISQRNIKSMRIWPHLGQNQHCLADSSRIDPIRGESDRIRDNPICPESALQQTLVQRSRNLPFFRGDERSSVALKTVPEEMNSTRGKRKKMTGESEREFKRASSRLSESDSEHDVKEIFLLDPSSSAWDIQICNVLVDCTSSRSRRQNHEKQTEIRLFRSCSETKEFDFRKSE